MPIINYSQLAHVLRVEYGFAGLSIGVPFVLGKGGVEKTIELELSDETKSSSSPGTLFRRGFVWDEHSKSCR